MNKEKDMLPADHFQVFALLADSVIGELFQEENSYEYKDNNHP